MKNHKFNNGILGCVVMATYGKKRTYRITSINYDETPLSTFKNERGEAIAYADYFKNRYGLKIKDLK